MATRDVPKELDWVAARAACTAAQMFNELRFGVESDIRSNNEKTQASDEEKVSSTLIENGTAIAISRAKKVPSRRVFIALSEGKIQVYNDAMQLQMSGCVALNDAGRCILRLEDDGAELEQWQFRKRALESLFFGKSS